MKKLVSVNEVKSAADKGQKIFAIDSGTIITPAARDMARDLGLQFEMGNGGTAPISMAASIGSTGEQGIDRDMVYQIVKAVLANGLLGSSAAPAAQVPFRLDGDPKSGLKIIRGRTVKMDEFDTGNPDNHVTYQEVISKEDSKMSAGFLTLEKSSFDWELCYEEIDIVMEGSLSVTINGTTYHAHQGDVLFVPNGSKVTWSAPEYVKLFYVTYPANWADLMAQQ